MSKDIMKPCQNVVSVVGTLLSTDIREGKSTKNNRDYRSVNYTVRVKQQYEGHEDVNEIQMSSIAMKYKNDGGDNPAYRGLADLAAMNTAEKVGFEKADKVRITTGSLSENMFVSKSTGNIITGFRINSSFVNKADNSMVDMAVFKTEIFILDIAREMNKKTGEETSRLIVRGGIVQWNGKLDVVEFVAENPTYISFIERNWHVNDTVRVSGRIRCATSIENSDEANEGGFGETVQIAAPVLRKELIITGGDETPYDEEFAYSIDDIRAANATRKALRDQMLIDAKSKTSAPNKKAAKKAEYAWEE